MCSAIRAYWTKPSFKDVASLDLPDDNMIISRLVEQAGSSVYSPEVLVASVAAQLRILAANRYGFWRLQSIAHNPAIQVALISLLGDHDKYVRREAIWALSPLALQPDIRASLLASLGDPSWYVRRGAVSALRPHAQEPEVRNAFEDLLYDSDCNVLRDIRSVLSGKSPEVVNVLRTRINDEIACIRLIAAEAVAGSFQVEIHWTLMTLLLTSPDSVVRRIAIDALGRYPDDASARHALINLMDDPDSYVQRCAIRAMHPAAIYPEVKQLLLAKSRTLGLEDRDEYIRALETVATDADVYPTLVEILHEPGTTWRETIGVRAAADTISRNIAKSGSPDFALLAPVVNHQDFSVRDSGVLALRNHVRDPEALALLQSKLTDPVSHIRLQAAKLLVPLADSAQIYSAVKEIIIDLLVSGSSYDRYQAAYALHYQLGQFQSDLDILQLVSGLQDDRDAKVHEIIASILGKD